MKPEGHLREALDLLQRARARWLGLPYDPDNKQERASVAVRIARIEDDLLVLIARMKKGLQNEESSD